MKTETQYLTVREQQFLAYLRGIKGKFPSVNVMARDNDVTRQRIYQLIDSLKSKKIELNGKGQSLSARQK